MKQSLAGLEPRLRAVNERFATLHKQFDPLPPDLPGFADARTKFYNTDEGLGIMGPKLRWLSERLQAALKSGDRAELQRVSADIRQTYAELRLIDQIASELTRELLSLPVQQ